MTKKFKKIVASVMAVASLTTGAISSLNVSAADWSTRYVNGAPGSESYSSTVSVSYSTKGAKAYCNAVSNSINGGSGYTTVSCTNYSMASKTLNGPSTNVSLNPSVSGIVSSVSYKFSGYSGTRNNCFTASGTVNAVSWLCIFITIYNLNKYLVK